MYLDHVSVPTVTLHSHVRRLKNLHGGLWTWQQVTELDLHIKNQVLWLHSDRMVEIDAATT